MAVLAHRSSTSTGGKCPHARYKKRAPQDELKVTVHELNGNAAVTLGAACRHGFVARSGRDDRAET